MGLAGQNQTRQMYVGNANISARADISSIANANELAIFAPDGSAISGASDIAIFYLTQLGNVTSSGAIKADNILDVRTVEYQAPTLKSYEVSDIVVNAGTTYTVNVLIKQHGSLSPEDEYLKHGFYTAKTGDTDLNIVNGLVASLNQNFSREVGANATSNPYLSFSTSGSAGTAVLAITEKSDWLAGYDPDKKPRYTLDFTVDVKATTYPTVEVAQAQSEGKGTGYQIQEMEYFLLGERGDTYRQNAYPHNILGPALVSQASGAYNVIEISYFDEGRDEAKKSKKTITLAFVNDDTAGTGQNLAVNTSIIDVLNNALGLSLADFTVSP